MNEGGEFFTNTSSIQFLDVLKKMTGLQEKCLGNLEFPFDTKIRRVQRLN